MKLQGVKWNHPSYFPTFSDTDCLIGFNQKTLMLYNIHVFHPKCVYFLLWDSLSALEDEGRFWSKNSVIFINIRLNNVCFSNCDSISVLINIYFLHCFFFFSSSTSPILQQVARRSSKSTMIKNCEFC